VSSCLAVASSPQIAPLSLHDALPICRSYPHRACPPIGPWSSRGSARCTHPGKGCDARTSEGRGIVEAIVSLAIGVLTGAGVWLRSEEHTSELQSRENLVCRLLLEKKK